MTGLRKWLTPGMHIKRWIALLVIGIAVVALGFAYILREVYQTYTFPTEAYYITLQFLPRYIRAALFLALGVGTIGVAIWRINYTLISPFMIPGRDDNLVDILYHARTLKRGPRIVAIGGGTGLPVVLRGLKEYSANITAIVTVADDGGSSGRLRKELGVLPPGDIRNCIAALADAEPLMTRLLQYRFDHGSALEGHSFGNLFIVAMTGIVGNFEQAIRESSRVLAVRGQILPSTLENITLGAHMEDEATVRGESNIPTSGQRIKQLFIEPAGAQAHPEAVRALLEADLIVMGPGSLYTSLLPNLLVNGIQKALRASTAAKVYVCNVATQSGETDQFTVQDHIDAIMRHCGPGLFDYVLANSAHLNNPARDPQVEMVRQSEAVPGQPPVIMADLVSEANHLRHDPKKLGATLIRLLESKQATRRGMIMRDWHLTWTTWPLRLLRNL